MPDKHSNRNPSLPDRSTTCEMPEKGKRKQLDLDAALRWILRGMLDNRVLTQVEICAITGVSRSTLTQWLMDDERTITLKTAGKLISIIGARKFLTLAERHAGREALDGFDITTSREQHQVQRAFREAIHRGVQELQDKYGPKAKGSRATCEHDQ